MIKRATVEDMNDKLMPIIEEFYRSSRFLKNFNKDHCFTSWIGLLNNGLGVGLLLIEKQEIIGFLFGVKYPEILTGQLSATEMGWFVKESHRGKGLSLLKEFEKWAKSEGCKAITMVHLLDCMPKKLEDVYLRLGYEPIEVNYKKEF